jgi:hypothetical protein
VSRLFYIPFSLASGLLAGFIADKLLDLAWRLLGKGEEAPEPEQQDAPWAQLALALVIEGAIMRATRGLVEHGFRRGYHRATGSWPGEERDD